MVKGVSDRLRHAVGIFSCRAMRLVRVAKALGMTGQQLRQELESVNFGVKATDREIPENLAIGIIRFLAQKRGIEVDIESLGTEGAMDQDQEEEEQQGSSSAPQDSVESDQEPKAGVVASEESAKRESVHVLRKLTLEDVPQGAIDLQTQQSREERKKLEEEELRVQRAAGTTASTLRPIAERHQEQIKQKEGVVLLPSHVTVKEFAEKTGIQVPKVIRTLMQNGVMATINKTIDYDTAAIVASELGVAVQKEQDTATAEDILSRNLEELLKDEPENLQPRPPVVVVMGHVDHGKTSILDAIRTTDVVAGEAGQITQHIGAYQVLHTPKGSKGEAHPITFLDTPGHEAFTAMRARGAQVTDIAVIVVAADEGVKPTTVEAINHAKEAGVPVLVAINKMDRENADPDRVKGELAAQGLQSEDWGGQTPVVLCSAKTKQGIDELLDSIVLMAQMAKLTANPHRPAVATIIESHLNSALGSLGTVVVNTGVLRQGDVFVCGQTMGKVRTMEDAHGVRLASLLPSGTARISGFQSVPQVGDILQVVSSEQQARVLLDAVKERGQRAKKASFIDLVSRLSQGKLTQLKVVLKADAQGSLEAIKDALAKQTSADVSVKVIHAAVGAVSESDVMMAAASGGVVIAFTVLVPSSVLRTADREGVQVRQYDVVYALLDDIDGLLKGLIEPEEEEKILGRLEVRAIFLTKKSEQIVGGKVTQGVLKRLPFRIFREEKEVGTGRITSMKHVDKDIKEAKEGAECGLRVQTTCPVVEGDVLEVYLRELKRKEV